MTRLVIASMGWVLIIAGGAVLALGHEPRLAGGMLIVGGLMVLHGPGANPGSMRRGRLD